MTVTKTTDEDGNISYEFRDRNDEVTLIRQMSGTICHDTYYIRDEWGHLLAVLPPIAADQTKNTNTWYSSSTVIANYAYLYCYDKRYRQIGKKLPGCEWVFTIYDKSDYPVLTQDGRQRDLTPKEWTVTIPDVWSRPCIMATKTGSHSLNTTIGTASVVATRSGATYSTTGFTYTPRDTLIVNYYDDYTFIGNANIPTSLNYVTQSTYGTNLTSYPAGQLTGVKSLLLNDDPTPVYVYKAIFYDYHYKPVQTRSTNHLGGTEFEFCFYDLPGYLKRSLHVHSAPDKTTRQLKNTYTYDTWGRLKTRIHQIGSSTAVTLVDNTYDAIGRLKTNIRNNNTNLKTTYNYNVRSWLTSLVNPKFTESLYYNVVQYGGTSAARWGGDISGTTWCFPSGAYQSYDFSYDKLNRLTSAVYSDSDDNDDAFSTSYSYDKHGNITAITRNAITDDIGPLPLDELHLSYTGNQLTGVSNTANVYEFSNYYPYLAPGTNAFTYDQNGNTTKDLNKSISSIQYNLLNLPRRITYSDGSMATYTYTSLGEKVQIVYSTSQTTASQPSTNVTEANEDMKGSRDNNLRTAMVPTTMNYCGNVIYNGNSLSMILLDGEGYIKIPKTPMYYLYVKDHLGNVRFVAQTNGTVKQTNQYYPFGKRWDDMGETFKQPYLYNGKELDEMHDLSWYDYGARMYEPALGRFMTMDSMAEKYYNVSPYAYCGNNPTNAIDPDGKHIEVVSKNGEFVICGGEQNDDQSVYLVEGGNRKAIGTTLTPYSFFSESGQAVVGAHIDFSDKSGQDFLNKITSRTPGLINLLWYMVNALGGNDYDFKRNGANDANYNNEIYHNRGMKVNVNGKDYIMSARDIGNYAAGFMAGQNGISWSSARWAFDKLESYQQGKPSTEGLPTSTAERKGFDSGRSKAKSLIINYFQNQKWQRNSF